MAQVTTKRTWDDATKRKLTVLATILTGMLVASAVQASPLLWLQQLLGKGGVEAAPRQGPRGPQARHGYGPYAYWPGGGYPYAVDAQGAGIPSHPGLGGKGGPDGQPPHGAENGYGKYSR